MVIDQKLPDAYRCVDFDIFEAMLKIVANVYKSKIDHVTDLCSAQQCPDRFLPLLASKIGYSYIYETTPAVNREIIANFCMMIRNKGNRIGIRLAVSLGLLVSSGVVTNKGVWDTIYSVSVDVSYSSDGVALNITFPEIADPLIDTSEAINLMLNYALPAGVTSVTLTPATVQNVSTTVLTDMTDSDYTESQYSTSDEFNDARAIISSTSESTIGFTEIARSDDSE